MISDENKVAGVAVAVYLAWALIVLAVNVGIIWVIIHFISKYW